MSAIYFWGKHVATEDQYNDKNAATPGLSERGKARRRLAKAGAGAGVLLTLESKQAMATSAMCRSPSGSLSGGLSSHYGTAPVCKGLSPGYWKNHDNWPIPRTTMFASVFSVPGDYTKCDLTKTPTSYLCANMLTLLTHQSFDQNNLAMQTIAAYLNILSGRISFLSLETLQAMWREVTTTGYYNPTAGVTWTRVQVARYLDSIHD